jgi:hypothetical protein
VERLLVNPKYKDLFATQRWDNFERIAAHFLPRTNRSRAVIVQPVNIPTAGSAITAFFKQYDHGSEQWRFWFRASKARREFENYATLMQLGASAAEPIACGEQRDILGRARRAFLITRAVPDARTLIEFFRSEPSPQERKQVIRELAQIVRCLHEAHFYYYDLVWRNILVSRQNDGALKLFLIDCPRGGFVRFGRARKRLRDLASLDKSAAQWCSRTERLQFLKLYLGEQKMTARVRNLARACVEYRRTRWPEDWRGK